MGHHEGPVADPVAGEIATKVLSCPEDHCEGSSALLGLHQMRRRGTSHYIKGHL